MENEIKDGVIENAEEKKEETVEEYNVVEEQKKVKVEIKDASITEQLLKKIEEEQGLKRYQIDAVLKLLADDATVPFIARYRKEATGNLNEDQIRDIQQAYEYGLKLAERKEDVIRLIEEKGKLTEELRNEIVNCTKLSELEDIYRPYKEKKKTRATEAKRKGLEPLANWLLECHPDDPIQEAMKYVTLEPTEEQKKEDSVVTNVKDAMQGAMDIIAEMISDNAKFRKWIRQFVERNGKFVSEYKKDAKDEKKVYEMYYDYQEPISEIKLHRVLAMNRGETEKVLKISISEDSERAINFVTKRTVVDATSPSAEYIKMAIEDAYKRLIKPSIEREIRSDLKEKAEEQAIHVFSENLRHYLLTPPMKGKIVLGVDPGFRTGCKVAVVDATGKFLEKSKIYPHQKSPNAAVDMELYKEAQAIVKDLCLRYNVEVIAMGNGTASRETEAFIADTVKQMEKPVKYIIVSEAGASVYSACPLAKEEFPDFNVEERSAISIARRIQDPLAELIKIPAESIGVGQYQHDLPDAELKESVNYVVSSAVSSVGVNVNSASVSLLQRVSGLTTKTAKLIVAYRDEHGPFATREDLKIKGLSDKVLEQAIGFLRIPEGNEKLDMTSIHPESYNIAKQVLDLLGFSEDAIGSDELKQAIKKADRKMLMEKTGAGEYTLNDILDSFVAPLRDPRDDIAQPVLRGDCLNLEDLKPGMELQGTVRNVVDFGVFVDCGIHEDGLVHISKIKKGFIKHPLDVVKVGEIVKVWVIGVDLQKGRLQLTMIDPNQK